jgi:hypothetical protein
MTCRAGLQPGRRPVAHPRSEAARPRAGVLCAQRLPVADAARRGGEQAAGNSGVNHRLAQAALQSQDVHFGDDRNWLAGCRCERKQRRGRLLMCGQRALEDDRLIDEAAAPEMADRDDRTDASIAIAKSELARVRPSATVPPFGTCPEPSPIEPSDFFHCPRHRDALLQKSGQPSSCRPHEFDIRETMQREFYSL